MPFATSRFRFMRRRINLGFTRRRENLMPMLEHSSERLIDQPDPVDETVRRRTVLKPLVAERISCRHEIQSGPWRIPLHPQTAPLTRAAIPPCAATSSPAGPMRTPGRWRVRTRDAVLAERSVAAGLFWVAGKSIPSVS